MMAMKLTRDDVLDTLDNVLFTPIEVPTKVKTAFTREYNKLAMPVKKRKRMIDSDSEEEEDEEVKELDGEMELLNL